MLRLQRMKPEPKQQVPGSKRFSREQSFKILIDSHVHVIHNGFTDGHSCGDNNRPCWYEVSSAVFESFLGNVLLVCG